MLLSRSSMNALSLLMVATTTLAGCGGGLQPDWRRAEINSRVEDQSKAHQEGKTVSRDGHSEEQMEDQRNPPSFLSSADMLQRAVPGSTPSGVVPNRIASRLELIDMVRREKEHLEKKSELLGRFGRDALGPLTYLGFVGGGAGLIYSASTDLIAGSFLVGAASFGAGKNWVNIGVMTNYDEGLWLFDCVQQVALQHPVCDRVNGTAVGSNGITGTCKPASSEPAKSSAPPYIPLYPPMLDDKFSTLETLQFMDAIERVYREIRIAMYGSSLDYDKFKKNGSKVRFMVQEAMKTPAQSPDEAGANDAQTGNQDKSKNKNLKHSPVAAGFADGSISWAAKLDMCTVATAPDGTESQSKNVTPNTGK